MSIFKYVNIKNEIKVFLNIFLVLINIFWNRIIYKQKYIRINKEYTPKISVFLPIYNKEHYLIRSISSIQKQSLYDIEIIPVNDCSTDNSLIILKELAKKDSRIKIINSDKNHGLLYSRAMGILNSKGEYIMNLDPDDELEGLGNLKLLYDKAKKSRVDVLSFASLFKINNKICIKCSNFHKILRQPKLLTP